MTLLFGLTRSDLKWDPDSWRHFPDSAGDERFLDQLKLLRAPPKNLNPLKYMDCIAQGILRQHRAKVSAKTGALFWDVINAKSYRAFERDDVPEIAKALNAMPRSGSPVGAVAWATHVRDGLETAQRGRALTTLPDQVDLWFLALQPWTRLGRTSAEQPKLDQAPEWVQAYGAFLKDFEAGGLATETATRGLLMQLHEETSQDALSIAQRFVRSDVVGTHPAFQEAAMQMLEMLVDAPRLSETTALFGLASKLLEPSAGNAARIVSTLQPLVPHIVNRMGKPFLLETLSTYWNCDDVHRVWSQFPIDVRQKHAGFVLDRVCRTGVYEGAGDTTGTGAPLLDMGDSVWDTIEQEICALRPWSKERMRSVALDMPDTQWGLRLSSALDPRVEIIHTLVGEGWQSAWLQSIDAHTPDDEAIAGDVFEIQEP